MEDNEDILGMLNYISELKEFKKEFNKLHIKARKRSINI